MPKPVGKGPAATGKPVKKQANQDNKKQAKAMKSGKRK